MNTTLQKILILCGLLAWTVQSHAQSDVAADEGLVDEEDIYVLSPFVIASEEDEGYLATSTLAGTNIKTELKDVGSAITVVTAQFIEDTGSNKAEDLLVYTTSTEVAGQGGNFLGGGDSEYVEYKPVGETRVRGLAAADNLRDYFLSAVPWDAYNVGRVDLQRGPNSVLFGIGSPAGIINTSLNPAMFENYNEVGASFDNHGSVRFTGDFNREIIDDQLAVRISLLNDETKYKQEPSYKDDTRVFVTTTYNPDFLQFDGARTSIRANYEKGKIDKNDPLLTPPADHITPWFDNLNQATYGFQDSGDLTFKGTETYNPWLSRNPYQYHGGLVAMFDNRHSADMSRLVPSASRDYPATSDESRMAPIGGNMAGVGSYGNWAFNSEQPGYLIRPFKTRSLTDSSIFDFYNKNLFGPNRGHEHDWDVLNLALEQTFFDNKLGFEVKYNKENMDQLSWSNFPTGDAYAISVDIMSEFRDGTPNPNVGRPFVTAGANANGWEAKEERETKRITMFGELDFNDFMDSESWLARILGRHVGTISGTDYETQWESRNWQGNWIDDPYPGAVGARVGVDARKVMTQHYIGDSLLGASSASNAGLDRLMTEQTVSSGYATQWNSDTLAYHAYQVPVVNGRDGDWDTRPYTGGVKNKNRIKSLVAVWQGFLLDGAIVPMVGWRRDIAESWNAGAAPETADGKGLWDVTNPAWDLPTEDESGYNKARGETRTYSVVGHIPASWTENLPLRPEFSLFYSQSENFRPDAGRRDVLGNYLPSPTGKTKDYGVTVSMLDGKFLVKVNRYKTEVLNDTLGDDTIPRWTLAYEAWNQHAAWAYYNDDPNDWHNSAMPDGWGVTSAASPYGAGHTVRWEPLPSDRINPSDTNSAYTQASLDYWYGMQREAVESWLANPIPESMQEAWGMTNYGDPSYQGQFNWGAINSIVVNGSTVSEGTEIEIVARPIKGLDLSINASKTDAKRVDIGSTWSVWVEKRYEQLSTLPLGNMRTWSGQSWNHTNGLDIAVNNYRSQLLPQYNLALALNNTSVSELRPWRFNAIANYTIQDGRLKGMNVGGSVRWMDKQVVGYRLNDAADAYDINDPWYGPTETAIDLWGAYTFKIRDNIDWKVQLNIRNAFASEDLIPITVQPDGSAGTFRIPEPRTITLSNTIEF